MLPSIKPYQYYKAQRRIKTYDSPLDINGFPCAGCGLPMLTGERIKQISQSIELPSIKALKNQLFDSVKSSNAYFFLQSLAKRHPATSLRKLVQNENTQAAILELDENTERAIRLLTKQARKIAIPASQTISKISKYKSQLSPELQIAFEQLGIWAKKYKGKTFAEIFKMPEVVKERKELIKSYREEFKEIMKSKTENPYRFLHRNRNSDDKTLVENLLKERLNTFEHVKRKSDNGPKAWSNGICLCSRCNGLRTDRVYPEFLSDYPQMIVNAQKQMDTEIKYINRGQLPNQTNHPEKIKARLYDETSHMIDLNIDKAKKR